VVDISWDDGALAIQTKYADVLLLNKIEAHYLVNATGFDLWSLLKIIKTESVIDLLSSSDESVRVDAAKAMLPDLSFGLGHGIPGGLHVPAIAARKYGPGYGNLGCLGLMAKDVLQKYNA
jgi:hypothetical protein